MTCWSPLKMHAFRHPPEMRGVVWRDGSRRLPHPRHNQVAAAIVVAFGAAGSQAASVAWDGGGGNSFWDVAANWSTNLLPGATDDALLGTFDTIFRSGTVTIQSFTGTGTLSVAGGSLSVSAASSTGGLNLSAGTIGGAGNVSITGELAWTGGTMTGAGSTFVDTVTISGTATKSLAGGRILNAGNTNWSGNTGANNTISIAATSIFNSSGSFSDSNTFDSSISGGTFNNSGSFTKQSNTTTTVGSVFNNSGTVNVNAGNLLMQAGGTSTGIFNIADGAKIEFRNGTHVLNNVITSGAGTLQISTENVGADALVTINGGTLNSAFHLSGSTLNGENHVFKGPSTWSGGTITGSAAQSTGFDGALSINGSAGKTLSGGRSVNAVNTTWSGNTGNGNNAISLGGVGTFNNTGSFTDANAFDSSISAGTFNNSGIFNKQSNTTTSIGTVFNSTGTVNVNAGTMLMNGGGTGSGVFNIANGAKLEYRNGSHTLNSVTTSGAGTFEISTENVGADASVALNGGTHTTAFVLSGSTLSGSSHTFQGVARWTGGTLTGTAAQSTTFANALTISGPNAKTLSGGRSVNAGDTAWTGNTGNGNNAINISGASVFNSNGTFTDANTFDSAMNRGNGGGVFNNIGIFNKQSNTTTVIGTAFNNSGTVNVNAGTMLMSSLDASTSTGGVYNIAGGAKLEFRNGSHTLNNVTTAGAGTFEISTENVGADATVFVNGGTHTSRFVLSGSTMAGSSATFRGPATWTGGAISGAAITTFDNDVTISGANLKTLVGGRTVVLNGTTTWSGNTAANNNAIRFWNGATIENNGTFNDSNAFASFIEHNVGGPHNFNNNGTYNKQSNTLTTVDLGVGFNNSGTLNLNAGTMLFTSGTQGPAGTVRVASGATFQIAAASTAGNMITAGNLALADRTLTIFKDYDNANFGVGNAFNRRANVTTTGAATPRLLAAGDVNQGLSGIGISNGNTSTPTIVLGNVHVGASNYTYNINNTGSTGPALRGAIQNAVNGGNITDARLSGNGVLAGNFGPIAAGQSESRDITITIGSAGVYAPFTGQAVSIVNNFENTRSQLLTITSASGAAAYNLAAAEVSPNPVNLGNQRVGGTASGVLTISNTAPAGSFTEGLNAAFGTLTGAVLTNGGAVNLLAGGASNSSAMGVRLDGSTAGAKSGTAQIVLNSDGTGTSGLGITALPSQTITVNGSFFNAAVGGATPSPIVISNQRVGGSGSQLLAVSNTAAAGGFSEALNAAFSGTTGAATTNGQSINNLAAGGSNATTMAVGVNTGSAGAKTGTVTLAYQSDGTGPNGNSGLAAIAAGTQTINVSGNVYQVAQPTGLPTSVNLGNFRAGTAQSQTVTLTNNNISPAGFQEGLNASIVGTSGAATGSGALNNVAAGASGNLQIGVSGVAGANTGSVQVQLATNGSGTSGLGILNLGGAQTINVTGTGWRLAAANAQPTTINFGNVLVGSVQAQALNIQNTAIADGFSERLDASFLAGGTTGAATNNGGSIGLLAAGASNNTSMSVGVNTSSIGAKTGQVIVAFNSNGLGTSGLGITSLPNQNIGILAEVTANVGTLAQPSAVAPNPVNFGNFRVGVAGAAPQSLTISNLATVGEGLNASIATASTGFAASGAFTSLAPQTTNNSSLQVSFNGTGTAGAKTGTATVTLVSDGTFNGGTTTPLPSQTVTMNAGVYNAAVGSATPTPVVIANQRVGGTGSQVLTVANTAASGAFSEALNAVFSGTTGAATNNGGSVSNLIAGGSNSSAMSVGINTASAGAKTGMVTLAYQTDGTGPNGNSGLAAIAAGTQTINVSGNVYNAAAGNASSPVQVANQRIGGSNTDIVTVTNTAAPGSFSEDLNASVGATGGAASGSGSIAGRLAGASSGGGSITVGVDSSTSGAKTGTVTLDYKSAGTVGGVSNGLGTLAVGSQVVTVNGNVYQAATGAVQTAPLNFGTVQVGQSVSQALVVRNTATGAAGFVEDLNASFGNTSGTGAGLISGTGSLSGILAGTNSSAANGTMMVSVNTVAAGVVNGSIALNYFTAGAVNGVSNGLGTAATNSESYGVAGAIQAVANVINQASPLVNTPSINLGSVRVGAAAPSAAVSVSNVATTAPQAALNASIASGGAPVTASGSFNLLNPGATNNSSLVVGLNTATAGNYTGANAGKATISLVSDAGNVGGCEPNCQLSLASQSVSVEGKVYTQAVGQLVTSTVDFGIVRVGDAVGARNITVQNTAAVTALNDTLRADLSGIGAPFGSAGIVAGVAAQGSGTIAVGLSTLSAGIFDQSGSLAFLSQNPDMADVAAGPSATVQVKAQVNNLANADFDLLAGVGILRQLGDQYVLDLGNIVIGSLINELLQLENAASGPADTLRGMFDLRTADDFVYTGWDAFTGLEAGSAVGGLRLAFNALNLGRFEDTIVFDGFGYNASDPEGLAQSRNLLIRANVVDGTVPEPGSAALALLAMLSLWLVNRRRQPAAPR